MGTTKKTPVLSLYIGNKIKELRKQKGLTGDELAKCIGLSQQQVSRYELGVNYVHIDLLAKLADIFQVPLQTFIPDNNI
ncbi:helix-turn-helix domain-containing protein [Providencia sp. Me31A]|uniref:helix-turn-helix domain-containing protein n=1 Tax=Providencia sp. Me31A TaxID=3392637 RepID=UPI003D2B4EC6